MLEDAVPNANVFAIFFCSIFFRHIRKIIDFLYSLITLIRFV